MSYSDVSDLKEDGKVGGVVTVTVGGVVVHVLNHAPGCGPRPVKTFLYYKHMHY